MIIQELKGLYRVAGALSEIKHALGLPRKQILESVMIGLPVWDPPEEKPPLPPDQAAVDRVKGVIGVSSLQERRSFDKVMQSWRQIIDGQPPQPAPVPRRPELPPPGVPAEEQPSGS